MSLQDFIIWVFCWIEDNVNSLLNERPIRKRGFAPKLSDSEVITMEVVGEFLEIPTDKGIWRYFSSHWKAWFPQIGSRANFAKQASNLWAIKQKLQEKLAFIVGAFSRPVHIVDGFPIPVCGFKRAQRSSNFKGDASFGYCAAKDETYYGFKGHLMIDETGVITGVTVTPAHASEREATWELSGSINGWLLGDKGYMGARFIEEMKGNHIHMITPLRANMKDSVPKETRTQFNSKRRLVETVIGQLSERFSIEKCWARDLWHLSNRVARKVLAHTLSIFANRSHGKSESERLKLDDVLSC